MTRINESRVQQVRGLMARERLDALICRLPEHVVLLTGYWPVIGRSAAVLTLEHGPILLAPEMEADSLEGAWAEEVLTFRTWRLGDPDPEEGLSGLLATVAKSHALIGRRVGADTVGEDIAPTQRVTEPWSWGAGAIAALAAALGAAPIDAANVLIEGRAIKFAPDVARLGVANEVAGFGLEAFFASVGAGRTEAEVAAAVEAAILARGTGHRGTRHARGQAVIFSGSERLGLSWGYAANTDRRLLSGDAVMIELAAVADGYWSDLTRMAAVGPGGGRLVEVYDAVVMAQQEALATLKAGARAAEVDAAARSCLRRHKLDHGFIHHTGHGLGFRYHEPVPWLHPQSTQTLAAGMVTSVEPGVYLPEIGGVRVEDNVVVTESGATVLSDGPVDLQGRPLTTAARS